MKKTIIILAIALMVTCNISVRAESTDSTNVSPSFLQGVAEYRQGNYNKAVNIMDKLVQISPDDYRARYYMAISLVKLKKVDEAKEQYMKIISSAQDKSLVEYSKEGLKLLDPKSYKKIKKDNFSIVESNDVKQDNNTASSYVVEAPENASSYNGNISLTPEQQQSVSQIAKQNNVSPEELNNLIKILASNPSALKTINKLASGQGVDNANAPEGYDSESVAKLLKMLAFNSQMNMFNFDNNNNNNNNGNNGNSMDMMSMMMGGNGNNNNNNSMEQLMNYMSNPANKGKINPETINSMFKQNMLNGFGMNGF